MEVSDRQQVGLPLGEPYPRRRALTLRTVPVAAGVIDNAPLAAVLAGLDMTAKGWVRQCSIADMTLSWVRLRCLAWAAR